MGVWRTLYSFTLQAFRVFTAYRHWYPTCCAMKWRWLLRSWTSSGTGRMPGTSSQT
ncbi:hypothetical protein LDENG_00089010 [Lucifuga dentata]|nr:hypothetical protein LDENG_00089010 [Lucifuga dentata]